MSVASSVGSATRLLLFIGGLFATGAIIAMGLLVKTDYDATLRAAAQHNVVLTQLLEEHARRAFDVGKASLVDLSERVMADGEPTVSPTTIARMAHWSKNIQQIASFWLIGEQGDLVYTSSTTLLAVNDKTAPANFSDRAYFKAHAAGEEYFVGGLTRGRLDGKWFFSLSHRLEDSQGHFRGVLLASMPAETFTTLYSRLGLGPQDNIGIYKQDGTTVVRRLLNWTGDVAPSNAKSSLFTEHLPQHPAGVYESTSPIDGISRILAYRAMEGWPLIVASGAERSDVLKPWRKRTRHGLAYCFVVLCFVGGLTAWGCRKTASESVAQAKNVVLLNEVHHRVKNNLAIIQSLLMLEANRVSPEARRGYDDSVARVAAMGLVHNLLYQTQTFEGVNADDYLHRLCQGLQDSAARAVRIVTEAEPLALHLDIAMPLALIVNELVTNALKHAFRDTGPERDDSIVSVRLRRDGGQVILTVRDNGKGLPTTIDTTRPQGLGLRLVTQLTRQLKGSLAMESSGGAAFVVSFPWNSIVPNAA